MMELRERNTEIVIAAYWLIILSSCLQQTHEETLRRSNYDYIIVGAGSAGSVVANRLSSDVNKSVLLLEAGERPNLLSEIPNFYFYMQETRFDWNNTVQMPSFSKYGIELAPKHLPQGKIIGGTSSINGMIYVRGNKLDYNDWAKQGAIGWDWENVFTFFKKSENNQDKDVIKNGYHGTKGDMFVERPPFRTGMAAKYLSAAKELGYNVGDVNGPRQSVFMNPQLTMHNGRRWGSYQSFIKSIEGRRNFHVLTSAFVRKVLFERNKATGVQIDYKGDIINIWANKEVILSAGAIKTPQILMLSGIGPKDDLEKFNIPVISDLPVGKNFHDHAIVVAYTKNISKHMSGLSMSEADYNEFLLNGKGILSDISTEAIGFLSTESGRRTLWPDAELIFSTLIQPKSLSPNGNANPTSSCIALLLRPDSRGEITLRSTDPHEQPLINPKYLSTDKDVRIMVKAVKKCKDFANTNALKHVLINQEEAVLPQCQDYSRDSNEYQECTVMASVSPAYHLVGSCKMGNPTDPSSVVDPYLRVIGVKGLRVVDNSIVPSVPSCHTHNVAVMIGEKGSAIILETPPDLENSTSCL